MNYIINKFLLAGDKFMPEMHLKEPAVFNKNKNNLDLLIVLVDLLLKKTKNSKVYGNKKYKLYLQK